MIAFLDASALIDRVDGEAPWAQATQATLQQLAAQAPDRALAVSRLSLLECGVALLRRGDQASLDRFEALFAQPDLLVVALSASVVELATQLHANQGLRTPDALQAACCLHLAMCQRLNLQLASFDRGLCTAAAHHQVTHHQLLIPN